MVYSWWVRLRSSSARDVPFVLLGVFIGWNYDCSCAVKGNSMLPTLRPGDYILFMPYSLLSAKTLVGKPLVGEGDVVVMNISEHLSVCKRVVRATNSQEEAQQWCADHNLEDVDPHMYADTAAPPSDEKEWYTALSKTTRARDWDACIDRVPAPSQWLWLEGDNKDDSFDSRNCGPVPAECLRGKVLSTVYPSPQLIR